MEGEGRPGGVLGLTGGEGKRKECGWPGGAEARVQVPPTAGLPAPRPPVSTGCLTQAFPGLTRDVS